MKILLAHPGTQHAPRLAHELDHRGALGEFWTGLAFREGGLAAGLARRLGRWPALAGLATRIVPGVAAARLHTLPLTELRALRRLRRGDDAQSTLHERNRRFQELIPSAAFGAHDAVIGFDTSAWILGERARRAGKPFLLDRSIAHPAAYARIMAGLNRQYPAWAEAVPGRPDWLVAAEAKEHALAELIAVGGSFARDTLVEAGIAPGKIRINPYGVDWAAFAPPAAAGAPDRPFRFLYVGSVTARKGIPVLLDAWRRLALKDAELWIAGGIGPRERRLMPELPGLKLLGQVPRALIPGIFAQADVFVLPSMFEGFGLVLLEAVAAGLPLIATPHTGAVELIEASAPGRLVAAGSVDELAAAMQEWRADPGTHRAPVARARERLREKFSWTAYGDRSLRMLEEIC